MCDYTETSNFGQARAGQCSFNSARLKKKKKFSTDFLFYTSAQTCTDTHIEREKKFMTYE